ncbi:AbrB family transcriptional regulator [Janthinobacterium agaricidamnosum]|uniref:Membrane AbrB duplication domain protein n=1 Tax=Janthinobacterium agaricidamnosum NBRC 102515 = DSM 9628 TaxID=1349767 RepID=W0V9Y6_9BURK|nr:AbrB family transcriptional regulator [Janthinobacterium agaricidamnosum]CDG84163.1 membrane AbrB duplication domain protein [Janthinobacterium agaricidamnosum NBRC 102515 = DSM 9628]
MLRPFLAALLLGFAGAALCLWLNTPLPWMIGPLFTTAILRLAGRDLRCPVRVREAGQWAIGSALGLYFTAPVLLALVSHAGWIVVAVAFALSLGCLCGWLLHKLSGTDRTTAFFAMAVGGASEMAVQSERHGAIVERVAAAHSLRIMLVVGIIPFAIRYWGQHGLGLGHDLYVPGAAQVDHGGLLLLVLLTSAAALVLKRWNVPNAWVIGPLLMALVLTGCGIHLSRLPEWMIRLGQLFIGIALGSRFTPGFLHAAPRYLASVALCSLLAMGLAAGFGLTLAHLAGLHPGTAILATSPGGIAEMSLTAKTLHLGVPVVTAFHVSRMVVLVLSIAPVFNGLKRWHKRRQ